MLWKTKNSKTLEGNVPRRLLQAAIGLFAQKGYTATSVNEIVESAGVTKPVLYYYFRNKEGIFTELMAQAKNDFLLILQQPQPESDPLHRLCSLCAHMLDLFLENIDFVRFMYSSYYGPPQGSPPFDFEPFHTAFQQAIRSLLQKAAAQGLLQPGKIEDQAWVIIGALNCSMEAQLCHPENAPGRCGLQRMLALILRGIASEKYLCRSAGRLPGKKGKGIEMAALGNTICKRNYHAQNDLLLHPHRSSPSRPPGLHPKNARPGKTNPARQAAGRR